MDSKPKDDIAARKRKPSKRSVTCGIALLIIGACAILYPFARAWYYEYKQAKLLNDFNHAALLNSPRGEHITGSQQIIPLDYTDSLPVKQLTADGVYEEDTDPGLSDEYILANAIGAIKIPSINLESIILKGDTPNNLDIGICEVEGSVGMGDAGNYILAGHKSRIKGRHFSRLHEVRLGDDIIVSDGIKTYTYRVTNIYKVLEADTWIMDDGSKPEITLITCDYTQNPIGRLAVRAELID
ncbi:MAG: class D sortase [Clostridiales bacterium]|jgi:sortase A|nr:class D sortase [Clostridiales bacterium]